MTIKPCSCGSKPEIRTVGDYKQYFVCFCPKCGKSPMRFDEAQITKQSAIKIWNRRVEMDEYISREETIKAFCEKCKGYYDGHCIHRGECDVDVIQTAPIADVQPVKHGHWIINSDGYYPQCSECMNEPQGRIMTDFCPNCGAKMDDKK